MLLPVRSSRSKSSNRRARRKATRYATARLHGAIAAYALVELWQVPIEIPTEFGPIPLPVAIPQEGPPLTIHRSGPGYTWGDVKDAAENTANQFIDGVTSFFSNVASVTVADVTQMIDAAISATQTYWSSFVNLSVDLTLGVFTQLTDVTDALTSFAIRNVADLGAAIDYLGAVLNGLLGDTIPAIYDEVHGLERWVVGSIDGAVAGVEAWAIDNIYNPLLDDITGVERWVEARVEGIAGTVTDSLGRIISADRADLLARIFAVAVTVAGLAEWVKECGAPMCDQFGPGTDLSKVLNALKGLLGLLAGLELATITEADLEHFARVFASIGVGGAETLITGFVEGGETLGTAAADILGDIGHVGTVVLHDLGIPV